MPTNITKVYIDISLHAGPSKYCEVVQEKISVSKSLQLPSDSIGAVRLIAGSNAFYTQYSKPA